MVLAISRVRVVNGFEGAVADAVRRCPRPIDREKGFLGMEVFSDAEEPDCFYLLTHWTDAHSFREWHGGNPHPLPQAGIPRGLTLDPNSTRLLRPEQPESHPDILETFPPRTSRLLAQFVAKSHSVVCIISDFQGRILFCNDALARRLKLERSQIIEKKLWALMQESDRVVLQRALAANKPETNDSLLLNFLDASNDPLTLQCWIRVDPNHFALIGEPPPGDEVAQSELLRLNNELVVLTRENAKKTRELQSAFKKISELANTDPLTGTGNRRFLNDLLQKESGRSARQGVPLTVVLLDLDHFKAVNDSFGHAAGDAVLVSLTDLLMENTRCHEPVIRYGGEEFLIFMPGESMEGAVRLAERLRRHIQQLEVPKCPKWRFSASFGVSTISPGESPDQILSRADTALYRAKDLGRNRVETEPSKQPAPSP